MSAAKMHALLAAAQGYDEAERAYRTEFDRAYAAMSEWQKSSGAMATQLDEKCFAACKAVNAARGALEAAARAWVVEASEQDKAGAP